MIDDTLSEMLSNWAFWLVGSTFTSLLILYVTVWAPRRAAQNVRRIPPAVAVERDPDGGEREVRVDVEQAMVAALSVHGDRIEAAHRRLLEARLGTTDERLRSLDRAEQLAGEAATARVDSHEAAHALAHVHWQRAELLDDPQRAEAEMRLAAASFQETARLRPRELDAYLGAGAVWTHLGRRWTGTASEEAYDIATGVYERAFEEARNNVALIRGWAIALDGLHRTGARSYAARRAVFDRALVLHRNGVHDLGDLLATMQASPEPPPAPNLEPFTSDPHNA